MQYLLLKFAETPQKENIDLSIVEYDNELNLNVIKGTKIPAITFMDQATETFTKTAGEGADSDRDLNCTIAAMADTSTQTKVSNESSDSDTRQSLIQLLDTSTQTFVRSEVSDSDKNFKDLEYLAATRTLTES